MTGDDLHDAIRTQRVSNISRAGLHPILIQALDLVERELHLSVRLVSGWRSRDQQERLWRVALDTYGNAEEAAPWVAPPGSSTHELGIAIDLGGDKESAWSLIVRERLPIVRPHTHEPWHFEVDPAASWGWVFEDE